MFLENWKMNYEEFEGLSCTVPCSMYSVLLEHGKIEDPYYGINELELTKLSEKDCVFETEFTADTKLLAHEYVELNFSGLDTICRIIVNGCVIDNVMNMHRAYSYDVKKYLICGTNTVRLEFSSPIQYFNKMQNVHYILNNRDVLDGATHLRKSFCMSGWDWGPRLPDMGIWKKVSVNGYDTDKIEDVLISQKHTGGKVTLDITVTTRRNSDSDIYVSVAGQEVKLQDGKCSIEIENPRLWWVRGFGEQYLYDFTTRIEKDGKTIDERLQKIGLRTLTVSAPMDEIGREFCFVINGVKIFAMGANYIPQDCFLSRITPERTRALLNQAVDANFNCIRVWGGGYYPEDEFYDICDELGLMVWQDFMFACTEIYLCDDSEREIRAEAEYNIKRLNAHASLALFCGNNEMEQYFCDNNNRARLAYLQVFERMLPDLCAKFSPDTFYWSSSPSSIGGFEDANNSLKGDQHYWKVWHSGFPFTDYRDHIFRFCSEYGFQSYPSVKTIETFCDKKDMNCFSRIMENHQKNRGGNKKILGYLADNYLYPNNFENLVYASQLLQADAVKYGVEHFRRLRGTCMGSIYWQFNDCWPVASWASVDYYGRYKPLHYAAKKFYAPVAMGLFLEKGILTVNISNETLNSFGGCIKASVCKNDFTVKESFKECVNVDSLASKDVFSFALKTDNLYDTYIAVELFDENGNFIMRQVALDVPPKHFEWLNPKISFRTAVTDDSTEIFFKAENFAKGVFVEFKNFDAVLSDNCFDLTNREEYRVTLSGIYSAQEIKDSIIIKSVYDIDK